MRTVRCSGRLGGGEGCLPGGVCPGGCLPGGCTPPGRHTPPDPEADTPLDPETDPLPLDPEADTPQPRGRPPGPRCRNPLGPRADPPVDPEADTPRTQRQNQHTAPPPWTRIYRITDRCGQYLTSRGFLYSEIPSLEGETGARARSGELGGVLWSPMHYG